MVTDARRPAAAAAARPRRAQGGARQARRVVRVDRRVGSRHQGRQLPEGSDGGQPRRARSPSSPAPPAGWAGRTRSSSPARAPTSSPSTSARSSTPPTIPARPPTTWPKRSRLVEGQGRRILARQADVRDADAVDAVVAEGLRRVRPPRHRHRQRGHHPGDRQRRTPRQTFRDIVDVNLIGAWNTVDAAIPALIAGGRGGSIVLTSSTQGIKASGTDRRGPAGLRRVQARPGRADAGLGASACTALDPGQHHPPQRRRHRHDHQRGDHGAGRRPTTRGCSPSRTRCPSRCCSRRTIAGSGGVAGLRRRAVHHGHVMAARCGVHAAQLADFVGIRQPHPLVGRLLRPAGR